MTWVPVPEGSDFPLENLPFGVARFGAELHPRVVVRVGDHVLDLFEAGIASEVTGAPSLNSLMAAMRGREVRERASELLTGPERWDLVAPVGAVEVRLPFEVGDYVDFYSSIHHAENLGRMFRPDGDALLPNWRRLPVGYHGRAGTVVVSGTPVDRPCGLIPAEPGSEPRLAPTRALDIELEVGFVVGGAVASHIRPDDAAAHVFGVVLLNDWSARDIQSYEYQPLGPFLGKSFATTISPWVVTLDALAPFLVESPRQDPSPDPYLQARQPWSIDLHLQVELNGTKVSCTEFRDLYWTFAQQLAHMTVNGATTKAGDLFGSGTVSGPQRENRGSLIELTWRGSDPLELADGSTRTFLEDGDTVVLRGWCGGDDERPRIGFGECRGTIRPARTDERS